MTDYARASNRGAEKDNSGSSAEKSENKSEAKAESKAEQKSASDGKDKKKVGKEK